MVILWYNVFRIPTRTSHQSAKVQRCGSGLIALSSRHRIAMLGCLLLISGGTLFSLLAVQADGTTVSLSVYSATLFNLIAIPEKRIPSVNNNSTHVTLEVRTPGSATPLESHVVTTTSNGTYSGVTLAVNPGTYDFTVKGYSHLRRKKTNVVFTNNVTVDFTDAGANNLLCGDVNSTDGDNKVNGIDLSLIVGGLLGSIERLDLNQDGKVNGIDLTNAVSNINVTGDT